MPRPALLAVAACLQLAAPSPAAGQNPLQHFTEAFEARSASQDPVLRYTLTIDSTDLTSYTVEINIRNAPDTFRLAMVAHPEYDDRFWRFVEGFEVNGGGGPVAVRQDSAVWWVAAPGGASTVRYRIRLPPSDTPRSGWKPFLTLTGGLVGGPHSFMYVVGSTLAPSTVRLELPAGWTIATGLEPTSDPFTFFAPSAFVLQDSPILIGKLRDWRFAVDGVPHRVVYWPAPGAASFDTTALVDGVARLAREAIRLFGGPPYREFTFQLQDNAVGSLEHLNSVSVGAPSARLAEGFTSFFAELAHEYFHTWNLMRIRPIEYGDVGYRTPPRSRGLWWSEGITMYYADLLRRRAGLPTFEPSRVSHLENLISRYLARPGNARFAPESVSVVAYGVNPEALGDYDASTHLQGELIGTALDLIVRDKSDARRSLDDVMRLMLDRFSGRLGFTRRGVERAVHDVCACDVHGFFERQVRGAHPLDFNRYLGLAGLRLGVAWKAAVDDSARPLPDLRVFAWDPPGGNGAHLIVTDPAGAWGKAGLHTGDKVVAANGVHLANAAEFRAFRNRLRIGDTVRVEVERAETAVRRAFLMPGYDRPIVHIEEIASPTERQRRVREAWLAGQP